MIMGEEDVGDSSVSTALYLWYAVDFRLLQSPVLVTASSSYVDS